VSSRVGPILIAIVSVLARLAGQVALADMLAVTAFAALTFNLQRSTALRAAARVVRWQNDTLTGDVSPSMIVR